MITLTRKTKKETKDSKFFPLSHFAFSPRQGCLSSSPPWRTRGLHLNKLCTPPGQYATPRKILQRHLEIHVSLLPITLHENSRPEHNNATADAQRDREGSAARAGPRRRSPRPHACLLTDVGRNLSSVVITEVGTMRDGAKFSVSVIPREM